MNPPQEIVRQFFGRGDLERSHATARRIDPGHDVPDGAVLAPGVHGLKDDEQGVLFSRHTADTATRPAASAFSAAWHSSSRHSRARTLRWDRSRRAKPSLSETPSVFSGNSWKYIVCRNPGYLKNTWAELHDHTAVNRTAGPSGAVRLARNRHRNRCGRLGGAPPLRCGGTPLCAKPWESTPPRQRRVFRFGIFRLACVVGFTLASLEGAGEAEQPFVFRIVRRVSGWNFRRPIGSR